jgi:hypothetical protein
MQGAHFREQGLGTGAKGVVHGRENGTSPYNAPFASRARRMKSLRTPVFSPPQQRRARHVGGHRGEPQTRTGWGCRARTLGSRVWERARKGLLTLHCAFCLLCSQCALAFLCLSCAMTRTPSWSAPLRMRVRPTTAGVSGASSATAEQTVLGEIAAPPNSSCSIIGRTFFVFQSSSFKTKSGLSHLFQFN